MKICLFCSSSQQLRDEYYADASALGALLAKGGHELIYGGGDQGLMGAAARGTAAEGGQVTGVAPRFFDRPGILFHGCTRLIFTETMSERKAMMESLAEAFIILPGGVGTFEEFFEVLTLKQLGRHSKPMAMVNTLNYFTALSETLQHSAAQGFMGKGCLELFALCRTPEAALEYVLSSKPVTGKGYNLDDYAK